MGVKKGSGRSRATGCWSFLQFRTEHPPSLSRVPLCALTPFHFATRLARKLACRK